jgi:competence protein ComEC
MKKIFIFTIAVIVTGVVSARQYYPSSNLQIMFYDIGQGDATLVKFPGNYTILIDGGPDAGILEKLGKSVSPLNKNLDLVLATHSHKDHTEGLKYVLERYKVSQVVASEYLDLETPILKLVAGDIVVIPTLKYSSKITIVWPDKEIFSKNCVHFCDINTEDPNTRSLVFLLEYGNFRALFTGDVPKEVLDAIISKIPDVDVVKVPHQGSRDAFLEDFYLKARPEIAVIPVGKNNYGHPDEDVVTFLEKINSKVYKTQESGSVVVEYNGSGVFIR